MCYVVFALTIHSHPSLPLFLSIFSHKHWMENFWMENCSHIGKYQNNTYKLTQHVLGNAKKHSTFFHTLSFLLFFHWQFLFEDLKCLCYKLCSNCNIINIIIIANKNTSELESMSVYKGPTSMVEQGCDIYDICHWFIYLSPLKCNLIVICLLSILS